MRAGAANELYSHRAAGRSRLKTTGRKTLTRTLPKWEEEGFSLPPMGRLLDIQHLKVMLLRAVGILSQIEDFPAPLPFKRMRRAAK